ncbi:MAG: Bax inhibitor-1/YccA family protein [Actinomycetota bacterium]|nr:Bax inhibitor-1/YccA family protein [Actinomycetota bacterium]
MNTAVKSAFDRIDKDYRPGSARGPGAGPSSPAAGGAFVPGSAPANGLSYGVGGGQPSTTPYAPANPFSAARAYDKLVVLCLLAVISAAVGYVAVPTGVAFACMGVAFALVLVSWFRMQWAKVIAPAYSVLEGVALGAISASYATIGHGIVPTAIVFTAGVFVAALVLYRTGLVRVTPRMMNLAFMGALGIIAVSLLSLVGLSVPGINSFGIGGLIFGFLALGVAVLNLFTDFEYVARSEQRQVSADAEWAVAFAMMTALVLVYVSILRILASAYGGGSRR